MEGAGSPNDVDMEDDSTPFVCLVCKREYPNAWRLDEHTKRAHAAEEERTCPYCSKVLQSASSLPRHLQGCKKKPSNEVECVITPRVLQPEKTQPHHKVSNCC
jgi:hypothetical protein